MARTRRLVAQAASGVGFATVSYLSYGHLPDLHGVAVAALLLKMVCAVGGISFSALYLYGERSFSMAFRRQIWVTLLLLAMTALTSAAVLRWFS